MENPTYNLQPLLNTLFQTVPIWVFIGMAVNHWVKKSHETVHALNMRLSSIEKEISDIRLSIATQGVSNLASNIEDLKDSRARTDMKFEAIFKILDSYKPILEMVIQRGNGNKDARE